MTEQNSHINHLQQQLHYSVSLYKPFLVIWIALCHFELKH